MKHLLATALTIFAWTTINGTLAYTDDAKRIPVKYTESARIVDVDSLPEFTEMARGGSGSYRERLFARLAYLRSR